MGRFWMAWSKSMASYGDRRKDSKRQRAKVQTDARILLHQKPLNRHEQRRTDVGKYKASGCLQTMVKSGRGFKR